jgi:hypothetical protein
MSEIRADTITASDGTSPVTLTKQSAAKAWVQGTLSAVISDAENISSGTDNGVGDYTYAFTNNMGNNNYAIIVSTQWASLITFDPDERGTASFNLRSFTRADSLTVSDNENATAIHGDLA